MRAEGLNPESLGAIQRLHRRELVDPIVSRELIASVIIMLVMTMMCRVAGNVVNDFVMGSIVNAVQLLGVRLVMVLGHTKCGMVARAVHHWAKHEARKLSDPTAHSEAQARSCLS